MNLRGTQVALTKRIGIKKSQTRIWLCATNLIEKQLLRIGKNGKKKKVLGEKLGLSNPAVITMSSSDLENSLVFSSFGSSPCKTLGGIAKA